MRNFELRGEPAARPGEPALCPIAEAGLLTEE
jgi:hypothetical protein